MKALITGASGTVGTALAAYLQQQGVEVVAWNRQEVAIDHYHAMENYIKAVAPDMLFHLATSSQPTGRENESWLVNYEWSSELAWITRLQNIRFIFTSSVMVYTDDATGPFTPESTPNATSGYGYEKRMAEGRVLYQNPDAVVAQLGWQIGETSGSNNMIDFFTKQIAEHGEIRASTQWYPACSLLADTVAALYRLAQNGRGLYLLNQNMRWTFYEIAVALNKKHGEQWTITPTDNFVYDQRMLDERVNIPALDERLIDLGDENMSEKIMTLHPQGKKGVNIDKQKYTVIREAILQAIDTAGEISFTALVETVEQLVAKDFEGSVGWYTTTVKLDLEARHEIERIPNSKPQWLRRVQPE